MKKSTLKFFAALLLSICFSTSVYSQIPLIRTTFTAPFVPVNTNNGGTLSTAVGDDAFQDNIPIGFTFNYLGTNYTNFHVSTNGIASFSVLAGVSAANLRTNTNLFLGTSPLFALAPWNDDLAADSIIYTTTGTAGSQVFTCQWYCKSYFSGTVTQKIPFQVKLYETTNVIEYHYGNVTSGAFSTSESASIGLKNGTGGPGNFIDAVTGSSFVGTGYMTSTTKWPSRFYRFTPGTSTALAGGTYNVGAGQTYPTLDEAVADVNHRGITGPVILSLTQSLYDVTPTNGDNIFPVFFGPVAGLSAVNTISVQPASGTSTLSYSGESAGFGTNFSSTSAFGTGSEPIIGVIGGNNITFKNLMLSVGTGSLVDRGIAFINYSPNLGSTSNAVRNCSVSLNRANTSSIGFETRVPTAPAISAGANSSNTFIDISVSNSYAGIFLSGNATFPDQNNMITTSSSSLYNSIGANTANDIGNGTTTTYGIQALNQSGVTINNNEVKNVSVSASVVSDGIFLNALQGTSQVHNNKVMNIRNNSTTATSGVSGIRANVATTGTHEIRVYNNFVSGITSGYTGAASATRQLKGIFVQSGGGGATTQTINIDFNNVSIDGSATPNISSSCYEIGTSTGPVINTRNNVFANFTGAQTSPARHIAWHSISTTLVGNTGSMSNYNDLYIDNSTEGYVGQGGTTGYATLANWQTATTQDANSQSCNPSFLNNVTDLHVAAACLDGAGNMTGISWVATDIDNTSRSSPPDIGADEFTFVSCSSVTGGTQSVNSFTRCAGQTVTLTTTGATSGAGIVYQWQVSATSGGPYSNVTGGSGANTTSYITAPLAAGSYYYILLTTCTTSSLSATSNEATVTVNPIPTVSISPSTGTICLPGGSAITLTGSGATTYSWLPIAGLSATTGVAVNALPLASTVYTVAGATSGCTATAMTTITIVEAPSLVSITASPSVICAGNNSTLTAKAGLTTSYTLEPITFAPVTTTAAVTVLANNGTAVAPLSSGTLDDGGWSNLSLPFNFNFYGNTYSSFAISTNGFIYLGSGNPGTFSGYGTAFPSTTPARPAIGAIYSDIDFDGVGSGSTINYFVTGTSPNQMLVINWNGEFFNNTGTVSAQAILYETSNVIEVHTYTSTGVNPAVQGIQNAAGTVASVVSGRNATTWSVSVPDAYRWTPDGTVSYNWTPSTFLSATNISNPVANNATVTTNYSVNISATNGCSLNSGLTLTVNPTPTVVPSTSAFTICSGLSATLTATGATTYTWSTGATGSVTVETPSVSTTFSVTGETSGCTGLGVVTVSVIATPTVSASLSTPTICSGSSATLTATGATSYSWSSGAMTASTVESPSSTTTYTVIGEDNGCTGMDMITLTVTPTPTVVAFASSTSICVGGSATLTASGATTYSWSSGAMTASTVESPSVTTTYTVTGDNASCTGMDVITLTVNPNPTVTASASSSTICSGSSTTLTAVGASTYSWSSGAVTASTVESPTVNTTYTVTGDNGGCTSTDVISITVNAGPTVTTAGTMSLICAGTSVTLTASGAVTFTWSTGAMSASIVETPTMTTTYTVTGTDANGCEDIDTLTQMVSPCLGITALSANAEVLVYPNPNQGLVYISVPDVSGSVGFELYDAIGRLVMIKNITENLTQLNTKELPGGIYTYRIKSGGTIFQQGKLVRE